MQTNDLIKALETYVSRGWKCILLHPNGKIPQYKNWQSDYISTPEDIKNFVPDKGNFNIGIITGQVSNLLVADIDKKGSVDGELSLQVLEEEHGALNTYTVATPSGGYHLYFKYPEGAEIGNKVGFIEGCDIRSNNGFVVAPPSLIDGISYEVTHEKAPQTMPEWLIDTIQDNHKGEQNTFVLPDVIPEGMRNDTLFRYACSLNSKGLTDEAIEDDLHKVNEEKLDPPLRRKELDSLIKQALKYPKGKRFYAFTDLGNSKRFEDDWKGKVLYCSDEKSWYLWTGTHWQKDKKDQIIECIKKTVEAMSQEAKELDYKPFIKWAKQSQSQQRLKAIKTLAAPSMSILSQDFNKADTLFNVENATLDLESHKAISHDPQHYINICAPVIFDPHAKCPKFIKFLDEIFEGNNALISYWQRIMGYALTGKTKEQCIFMLYGDGKNGKSTLISTFAALLGRYHTRANSDTFLLGNKNSIRGDLARLNKARFVTGSEISQDRYLDESLIKDISGGETITARRVYENEKEFLPKFKLAIACNVLPQIRGQDKGIKRRLRIIPFNYEVPEGKTNGNLLEELKAELSGILNFALEGLREWQEQELNEPDIIEAITNNFITEMDIVQSFLEEECSIVDGGKASASQLYIAFKLWCENSGHDSMSQAHFGKTLRIKGLEKRKERYRRSSVMVYQGIRLKDSPF